MILTFSGKGANNVAITGVSDVVQIGIVNVTSTVETGTPITVNDAATFAGAAPFPSSHGPTELYANCAALRVTAQ